MKTLWTRFFLVNGIQCELIFNCRRDRWTSSISILVDLVGIFKHLSTILTISLNTNGLITKTQHCILIWIGFNITKYDNYNIFHPTREIFIHLKNELSIKHFKQNLQSYPVSQPWPYFFSSFTRNKKDHFSFLIYIYITCVVQ